MFLVNTNVSEGIPTLLDYLHNRDRYVAIAPRDDKMATSFIAMTGANPRPAPTYAITGSIILA